MDVPQGGHDPPPKLIFTVYERVLIRSLYCFSLVAGINYLVFRWYQMATSGMWIALPFVLSETVLISIVAPMAIFVMWSPTRRARRDLNEMLAPEDFPTVDILVPTYNEPPSILEESLQAALNMDWPTDKLNVYCLDDGSRDEVRELVEQLALAFPSSNIQCIARKKYPGVPHHAKAGNLNHAIFQGGTSGTFMVILDCDMIVLPHFCTTVISHFYKWSEEESKYVHDESMGMIQTPQDFYNVPKDDPLGQRYRFFYDFMLPCWEGHGCMPCCGTGVVFRRKAVVGVGGFGTISITEDVHTSMALNAAGYTTAFVPDHMVFGLTPTDMLSYYKQRQRWAVGSLQIMVKDPPFNKKGLTTRQKILYSWMLGQYCLAPPMFFIIFIPIVFLSEPQLVLGDADIYDYLLFFLPYYIPSMLAGLLVCREVGFKYWLRGQQENVYNVFINLEACLLVFLGWKISFTVTPKDDSITGVEKNLPFIMPQLGYYFCVLIALGLFFFYGEQGWLLTDFKNKVSYTFDFLAIGLLCFYMSPPISFFFTGNHEHIRFRDFVSPRKKPVDVEHPLAGQEHTPLLSSSIEEPLESPTIKGGANPPSFYSSLRHLKYYDSIPSNRPSPLVSVVEGDQ